MLDNTLRKVYLILLAVFFITGCTQANNETVNNTSSQQSTSNAVSENTFVLEDKDKVEQILKDNPALAMYIDKINSHEWNSLYECFADENHLQFTQRQIDNKEGITSVEHIELKAVKEMTEDDWSYITGSKPVASERGEYKELDKYDNIKLWFLIFDESVDTVHENKYYPQGLVYNLAITGERNDNQYIIDLRNESKLLFE